VSSTNAGRNDCLQVTRWKLYSTMHGMDFQSLATLYRTKTADELLYLAAQRSELTSDAYAALSAELATRRIEFDANCDAPAASSTDSRTDIPSVHVKTGEFIEEVLRFYNQNRWTFMKLVFPAIVVGTIAVIWGRHESREISQHLYREGGILRHPIGIVEIGLATWGSYLVSWIAFCFSFGAICSAVEQVHAGFAASIPDSVADVRQRLVPFLRLSLILWLVFVILVIVAMLFIVTILSVTEPHPTRARGLGIYVLSLGLFGLVALILSRFSLAMPALILDDYSVKRAMFRSDTMTRSNWPILAALLFKSIAGGYVAGMLPFWLARWIPASINLPSWFSWILTTASIAAVTVVEPIMFIGFALLYLKTSAPSRAEAAQTIGAKQ
jgi:hypothetical protein